MFPNVNVLDIDFAKVKMEQVVSTITNQIRSEKKLFMVTANPEIVMYAKSNPNYKKVLSLADFIVADGIGVVIGSKILKHPLPERIAGFDVMVNLLDQANLNKWRVFLLGAKEEVLKKAVKNINKDYPNLVIAGSHHGYFKNEDKVVSQLVRESEADIILVALGFPRQEEWIANHISSFSKGVFIGVGGSFDVLAGEVQRAPMIWQKLNVEWLYRLLKQPSRWRRQLLLPKFILEVVKEKYK